MTIKAFHSSSACIAGRGIPNSISPRCVLGVPCGVMRACKKCERHLMSLINECSGFQGQWGGCLRFLRYFLTFFEPTRSRLLKRRKEGKITSRTKGSPRENGIRNVNSITCAVARTDIRTKCVPAKQEICTGKP